MQLFDKLWCIILFQNWISKLHKGFHKFCIFRWFFESNKAKWTIVHSNLFLEWTHNDGWQEILDSKTKFENLAANLNDPLTELLLKNMLQLSTPGTWSFSTIRYRASRTTHDWWGILHRSGSNNVESWKVFESNVADSCRLYIRKISRTDIYIKETKSEEFPLR